MSEELEKEGYTQNLGKAELLPRVRGRGAQNIMGALLKIPSDEEKTKTNT